MKAVFETNRFLFTGEENFNQLTSNRVVAFASRWTVWRGVPSLHEKDLLCYLTETIGNPFSYVFFSCDSGDSDFAVKGRRVYRDRKLYGASVSNMEEFNEVLAEAHELSYLELRFLSTDSELNETIIRENAGKFSNLKYLCSSLSWNVIDCFLQNCPIEYFHNCGSRSTLDIEWLSKANSITSLLGRCGIPSGVFPSGWLNSGIKDKRTVKFPGIKYLSVSDGTLLDYVKEGKFPSLEGIFVDATLRIEEIAEHLSAIPKVRIFCGSLVYHASEPVDIPEELTANRNLEHFHLQLDAPSLKPQTWFESKQLRSFSIALSSESSFKVISTMCDTSMLELLTVDSLDSLQQLTALVNLKGLRLKHLPFLKGEASGVQLSQLFIDNAGFDMSLLHKILTLSSGGLLSISNLGIPKGLNCTPELTVPPPSEVRFLSFSGSEEVIAYILEMLKGCRELILAGYGSFSEKTRERLKNTPFCFAFSCSEEVYVKNYCYFKPEESGIVSSTTFSLAVCRASGCSLGTSDVFVNQTIWNPKHFFIGFVRATEINRF